MTIPHRVRGFSLVEVTIALGIAAFCLVVVYGLLSVAVNTSSLSVEQTGATSLLATVASDLRTAPPNPFPLTANSQPVKTLVYGLTIPLPVTATPGPAPSPTPLYIDANGQKVPTATTAAYQLNVWLTPGVGRDATVARLMLTWPPSTSLASATSSVETLVALDRN